MIAQLPQWNTKFAATEIPQTAERYDCVRLTHTFRWWPQLTKTITRIPFEGGFTKDREDFGTGPVKTDQLMFYIYRKYITSGVLSSTLSEDIGVTRDILDRIASASTGVDTKTDTQPEYKFPKPVWFMCIDPQSVSRTIFQVYGVRNGEFIVGMVGGGSYWLPKYNTDQKYAASRVVEFFAELQKYSIDSLGGSAA